MIGGGAAGFQRARASANPWVHRAGDAGRKPGAPLETRRARGRPSLLLRNRGRLCDDRRQRGQVMSMYLLMKNLPKEQFVATGAWFFLVVNLAKLPICKVITSSVVRRCSSTSR